jgi:transposase
MPRNPLPLTSRIEICRLRDLGYTLRSIASQVGCSPAAVSYVYKRFKETGTHEDRPRKGRPRLMEPRMERALVRNLLNGQCTTAVDLQKHVKNNYRMNVSTFTIRRALKRQGMRAVVKKKKPLLRKVHRQQRKLFLKKYGNWSMKKWKRVIWSDETRFNVFGSDGRQYAWKKPGERLSDRLVSPTVKFNGGGIMVWGCMTYYGVGYLCRIDTTLDSKLYVDILNYELRKTIKWYRLKPRKVIFQHDNDPKHTAKITQDVLKKKKYKVLYWPGQSPDLNPIEHLWDEVERRLRALPGNVTSKEDLWNKVKTVFYEIEPEVCKKLIRTMPRRMKDLKKAKGGFTKW